MNSNPVADFHTAITNHGLVVDSHDIYIDKLKRVKTTSDRTEQKSGWYCLFNNGNDFYCGVYGDWRQSQAHNTWFSKTKLTKHEQQVYQTNLIAYKKKLLQEQQNNLIRIKQEWESFKPCKSHPYLDRKQVAAHGNLKIDDRSNLIIPMYDIQHNLTGYQKILPSKPQNGTTDKYIASGSKTASSMCFIGLNEDIKLIDCDLVIIGEGYATCASVYEALNEELEAVTYCAIVAFSVNNLEPVVKTIVDTYPNKSIWLIADNDCSNTTGNNIGVTTCQKIRDKYPNILVYVPHGAQL